MDECKMSSTLGGSDACILHHTKAHVSEHFIESAKSEPVLQKPSQEEEATPRPSHLNLVFPKLQHSDPDLSELQPQDCVLAKPEDSYIVGDSSQILEAPDVVDPKDLRKSVRFASKPEIKMADSFPQWKTPDELEEKDEKQKNRWTDFGKGKVLENDATNTNSEFKGSNVPQFFAAFAANFGSLALGAVLSYTAVALPDLRERKSLGDITQFEESWIASTALLGAAASCPVVGFAIGHFGRRKTMLILTPFFVGGWLVITFAQDIAMIYTGRFMTGFCGGGFSLLTPVYITETSTANVRGALTSGFDMMLTVGILYIFVIGTYISWRWQALACGLIPIAFHLLMFFACESPRYLVEQGKKADASKALCWLRGASSSQQVEPELNQLYQSVEESAGRAGTWRDLFKMDVLKPTSIGLILMLNQQLSGIDAIMFYTVDIFKSAGTDINENLSAIIVAAIQVVATITSALVVDRCGRRFLLMLSEVFMVISLGGLGLFFYLKKHNNDIVPESLGWLPLTSLLVYVVAFSIGFGPTPWILAAEILPPHVKGLAYGIVTITRWILGFLVTIVFQDLMKFLGEDGGYWFFAGCCFLGGFYVYFVVPETKGKTLDEIQLYFTKSTQNSTAEKYTKKENNSEKNKF